MPKNTFLRQCATMLAFGVSLCALLSILGCGGKSVPSNPSVQAQINIIHAADIEQGKLLFKTYCSACHYDNMVEDLTGPALKGVLERWSDYPIEDLYRFIRDSRAMIESGHPKAVEQWKKWKPNAMNGFENLSNEEIADILAYIESK